MPKPETTRFAPSPSGLLHLGHAYSALFAARAAGSGGKFLLRIEDIDSDRARAEFEQAICEDLAWLGLSWEQPVRRQSEHLGDYAQALDKLAARGLVYPCFCTRKEIAAEIAQAGSAPHYLAPMGPFPEGQAGQIYPGTCRDLSEKARAAKRDAGRPFALRLDMARALEVAERGNDGVLTWHDRAEGEQLCDPRAQGDVVLARKELGTSYHIAVVVDDAAQGVTLVTRGADLFAASHVHRLLQALLGLPVPEWHHHRLLSDGAGQRLAKRSDALSLRALREAGHSAAEVIAMCGIEEELTA